MFEENDNTLEELEKTTKYLFPVYLNSIYEITGIALKLNESKSTVKTLDQLKEQLSKNKTMLELIKPLDSGFLELNSKVSKLRRKLRRKEDLGVKQLIEIVQELGNYVQKIKQVVTLNLPQITSTVCKTIESNNSNLSKAVESLKKNTMDATAGDSIRRSLDKIKRMTIEFQTKSVKQISSNNQRLFEEVVKTLTHVLDKFEKEKIVNHSASTILKDFDAKLMEALQTRSQEKQKEKSKQAMSILQNELATHTSPSRLGPAIAKTPQIKPLTEICDSESLRAKWMMFCPSLVPIKETLFSANEDLLGLKQKMEETRFFIDATRMSHIGKRGDSDVIQSAVSANMKSIENRTALMKNNIEMIETVLSLKRDSIEEKLPSRKKARLEDSSVVEKELRSRIDNVENKQEEIFDMLTRRKESVLGDVFPRHLGDIIKKTEQTLLKHEFFLSFMLDPISTSERRPKTSETNYSEEDHLSQPMVNYIQQLISKSTKEAMAPLRKQIGSLQEQLNKM